MVKKISAILLALVLCLSVVVIPASAAVELGDATIAFALEWDKDYYEAGETAYLSIYMDAADDIELTTGSFLIGLSSSVFSATDNAITTVKENAVTAEWFESFWKPASTQLSWLTNATQVGYVTDDSTAEENAAYDMYLKYTGGRNNQNGWHENYQSTKNGFSGSEFIADEPIMTIALVVREDVADGTAVSAAIMSGSTTTKSGNPQTHWKYLKTPGTATTTANVAATAVSVAQAVDNNSTIGAACDHSADKLTWTTVTPSTCKTYGTEKGVCVCGEYETTRALTTLDANNHEGPYEWKVVNAPSYTTDGKDDYVCNACSTVTDSRVTVKELIVHGKGQIRFHKNEDGTYANSFDIRALASIPAAQFEEVFTADKATQKAMIKEVGFVFAAASNVVAPSKDAVKALVENGTAVAGYTKKVVNYISTSVIPGSYSFSCIVTDVPDAAKTNSLIAWAYIAWDSNEDGTADSYSYYKDAQEISFETLFDTHYETAFGA